MTWFASLVKPLRRRRRRSRSPGRLACPDRPRPGVVCRWATGGDRTVLAGARAGGCCPTLRGVASRPTPDVLQLDAGAPTRFRGSNSGKQAVVMVNFVGGDDRGARSTQGEGAPAGWTFVTRGRGEEWLPGHGKAQAFERSWINSSTVWRPAVSPSIPGFPSASGLATACGQNITDAATSMRPAVRCGAENCR